MSENMYPEFTFPDVEVGDWVLWMQTASDGNAHPMLVNRVGDTTVEGVVHLAGDEAGSTTVVSGVRHASDPWLYDPNNRYAQEQQGDSGVFVQLPNQIRDRQQIAELRLQVAARDEVLQLLIERANLSKNEKDPVIPSIEQAAADVTARRNAARGRKFRGEPAGPAPKGTLLSSLIGG